MYLELKSLYDSQTYWLFQGVWKLLKLCIQIMKKGHEDYLYISNAA